MNLVKQNEEKYIEYINNHKQNVEKAWSTMKNTPECMELIEKNFINMTIDCAIELIDELVKNHDMTKFGKDEFDAYRKNFYPISSQEKEENKAAFEIAWKHHYTNNLHHWNWWYESGNVNNMPFVHVVEMICDWEAMGYQFGNTSKEWYNENKHKIHLGDKQKKFAEELMDIVCK